MLVLTRSSGERITITLEDGREINIWVTNLKNSMVRLGFDCDRNIRVERYDEEQKMMRELQKIHKALKIKCDETEFVNMWIEIPVPTMKNKPLRQVLREHPGLYEELLISIKKDFYGERT